MKFEDTGLLNTPVFRLAFEAGLGRMRQSHAQQLSREQADTADTVELAKARAAERTYVASCLGLAHILLKGGGYIGNTAVAAALAGPAAFSDTPDARLPVEIIDFARDVMALDTEDYDYMASVAPALDRDKRLFLQGTAVLMLETVAATAKESANLSKNEKIMLFADALQLYTAARAGDSLGMDRQFEQALGTARVQLGFPTVTAPSAEAVRHRLSVVG